MSNSTSKQQPPDLGIVLAKAYQEFVRQLHEDLADRGFDDLGRSDGFVFRALANNPMTVSALATRLHISKQGAGQIIDDMERRRYVRRRADPQDARARLIELSARGKAALTAARAFHGRRERQLLREHDRQTFNAFRTVLTSLAGGPTELLDPQLRAMDV